MNWLGFILGVLLLLGLDLGLFHRRPRAVGISEATAWSAGWVALALAFAAALFFRRGRETAEAFTTGYLIELSLSLDNLLVITLIFAWFRVPAEWRHRVLFWGILGALALRGLVIGAGTALIRQFDWVLYLFGAFLLFTGIRMAFSRRPPVQPETNPVLRLARRLLPVSPGFAGPKFFTTLDGRLALTPLALALLLVETSDLLFAVDSIPAVFSVTRDPFIVFTSNVFAILGLRWMYFLLAGALDYFRYLKFGLSVVLIFVGAKMLVEPHGPAPKWFQISIPTGVSLLAIAAILLIAVLLSVAVSKRGKRAGVAGTTQP